MANPRLSLNKNSGMVKLNSNTGTFKVPKSIVRKKQKVLEEDVYLAEMGKIIQRDFFPDLERLQAQNDFLDAQSQNNSEKMLEIYRKYSSGRRPPIERVPSPATFETPQPEKQIDSIEYAERQDFKDKLKTKSSLPGNINVADEGDKMLTNLQKQRLSLDQYLASHTSEDNESFKEIQVESASKHRMKFAWLYKDENEINYYFREKLKVPSIEDQAAGELKPLAIDTWTYKNQNHCMYVPEGVELSIVEKNELTKNRHEIVHENTRLSKNPFNEKQNQSVIHELAMNQAKNQEGKIGVDGKIFTCTETPKINGFSFVRTPSPKPGVNESPLITWGEIEGTPFRLDGSDTPYTSSGPTFRIPEIPKREKIALALADKASESYRDKKRKAIEAARSQLSVRTPKRQPSTIDRLNEMSPAAQKLASVSLGCGLGTDTALRNSYSPSPKLRRFTSPYRSPFPKTPRTPKPSIASPNIKVRQFVRKATPVSVTDNLLKLPRLGVNRPRASDFF